MYNWDMWLIFGIGNPDKEYIGTRHNVGCAFLEYLNEHLDEPLRKNVTLAQSSVFVNTSGTELKKLKAKYKVKMEHIVVIHDDLDIEFGKFKISFGRNSAGHRGVQNIIDQLKTNEFWRVRIGIANAKLKKMRAAETVPDFVLSKFTPTEAAELQNIFKSALHGLSDHLNHD